MQIPPAGWSNPAAHTQQGLSNQRSNPSSAAESAARQLNPVEQSQKTEDRDANERYDGPMARQSNPEDTESQDDPNKESGLDPSSDCLHLPADDGETSQLDISG